MDMKRSEGSIRDLRTVVRYSKLPSRNELVFEFDGFVETAQQASAALAKFNSRIGRAVDHILSTNKWTLQFIDSVAAREDARGSVDRFVYDTMIGSIWTAKTPDEALLSQYLKHTSTVEEQINNLILEAQALLLILQNLDDRLDVISDIAHRDGLSAQASHDEILSNLWTSLGGNRKDRAKYESQLRLLKDVGAYRKTAWAHVSATIIKLQDIAGGLEDLRERVGAAEVTGSDVPLRVHMEHIQLGVERLERQRTDGRKIEGQKVQRYLQHSDDLDIEGTRPRVVNAEIDAR